MKKGLPYLVLCLLSLIELKAQQSVSIGTTNTNPSAVLWLNAPNKDQALIIPVVSSTGAVPSPVPGMIVYDQSTNAMFYYKSSPAGWEKLGGAVTLTAGTGINITGSTITNTGDINAADDITNTTAAAGDLSGTYPNPTVARIRGVNISATTPTLNQILQFDGTNWRPSTIAVGAGTVTSVALSMPPIFTVTGSPVTASGTLTSTLASQTAGTVLAAPSAAAGAPTFRTLAATDIPNLDATKISTGFLGVARGGTGLATAPTNGQLLIGNGTGYSLSALTAGAGINITNGAGTISIASTGLANPMTTQGDIMFGGAAGAATRLPGAAGFLKSTGAFAPTWSSVNLASADVTGVLPIANGGTGAATAVLARTSLGLGTLSTLGAVTTTEITDGTIANIDVNPAAAIAGTKIAPNFGAQNIITTGSLSSTGITSAGTITLSALAGAGNRMVTASPTGVLSTQALPGVFSTLNSVPKGDGTTGLVPSLITDDGTTVSMGGTLNVNSTTPGVLNLEGTNNPIVRYTEDGVYKAFTQLYNDDIIFGTVTPGTDVQFYNISMQMLLTQTGVSIPGYTQLGNTGPAIKTAKFNGTTSAASGGSVIVTLSGVPAVKIVSVYASVAYAPTGFVPSGYTINPSYEFQHYFYDSAGSTNIVIWNRAGNDGSLLSKPFTVYVTYEQ